MAPKRSASASPEPSTAPSDVGSVSSSDGNLALVCDTRVRAVVWLSTRGALRAQEMGPPWSPAPTTPRRTCRHVEAAFLWAVETTHNTADN
jgi:hypothetical protein